MICPTNKILLFPFGNVSYSEVSNATQKGGTNMSALFVLR